MQLWEFNCFFFIAISESTGISHFRKTKKLTLILFGWDGVDGGKDFKNEGVRILSASQFTRRQWPL